MLATATTPTEHHQTVDRLVQRWLHERQELIVLMCAINGLEDFTPRHTATSTKIQAFCQVLIDYMSAGHFEIYDELLREGESVSGAALERARRILAKLQKSTDAALRFNDVYDTDEHCEELIDNLPLELSELGELLAERFQLEDEMIRLLHAHATEPA